MKTVYPDMRLAAAASYVRRGARFVDVGTDHAYLPIGLVSDGIAVEALATDVNEGPLARAEEHIAKAGLSDRIRTRLSDGLCGIEDFHPTDVAVCGMGGELIGRIVCECDAVKDPAVRLILQPMTSVPDLRVLLTKGGFTIEDETLIPVGDRIYSLLIAHYTGTVETLSPLEIALGKCNISRMGESFHAFLGKMIEKQRKRCEGLRAGARPDEDEEKLLTEMEKLYENH